MKTIYGFPDYSIDETGVNIINIKTNHYVVIGDQIRDKKPTGYKYVTLCNELYEWKRVSVHRLVALTYLPNPNNLPEVNHKDSNKSNNNVINLEWCTKSQNIQHSFDNGRKMPTGINHWNTGNKASDETKALMSESKQGKLHPKYKGFYLINGKKYYSSFEAAQQTGLNQRTIIRKCQRNKDGFNFVPDPLKQF